MKYLYLTLSIVTNIAGWVFIKEDDSSLLFITSIILMATYHIIETIEDSNENS